MAETQLNTSFHDVCRRLLENVDRKSPDLADGVMTVAADQYRDSGQWRREMERIFLKMPLLSALSCDLPDAGDFMSYVMAGRPLLIVRGDDGQVRSFLNICRHRGARLTDEPCGNASRFVCPYHSWAYDSRGQLIGLPDRQIFGETSIDGLIPLPTIERSGAVFTSLDPQAAFDLDEWLGDMAASLKALRLNELFAYRKTTTLASPNWKLAADGYLDGYHIGYLHKNSIGAKAITNRNTYDLFGPHVRIGFANKRTHEIENLPPERWDLAACMSLVHFVFPNVSISGGHGDTLMLSRLFPGPSVAESTTVQYQYFRTPVEGALLEEAEAKRVAYEEVVRDEDCATIFGIEEALPAMDSSPIVFGRNEPGNQRMHEYVAQVTS